MKLKLVYLVLLVYVPLTGCQLPIDLNSLIAYMNITMDNIPINMLSGSVVSASNVAAVIDALIKSNYTEFQIVFQNFSIANVQQNELVSGVTVIQCKQGTYSLVGDVACTSCPAGTFSLDAIASSPTVCQKCPVGTYSTVVAASSASVCTLCPKDTWSNDTGANALSICKNCPVNSYSNPGSSAISQCVCQYGYYRDPVTLLCGTCPVNKFCSSNVMESCPANSVSPAGSNTFLNCTCNPGYYSMNGGCIPCSENYYCTGGKAIACPANSLSGASSSSISACNCATGYKTQPYYNQIRTYYVNMPSCNCTHDTTMQCSGCDSDFPSGFSFNLCSDSQTFGLNGCNYYVLTCPQGYFQVYSVNGYASSSKQRWYIAPKNGFEVILLSVDVFQVTDTNDGLHIYNCDSETQCTYIEKITSTGVREIRSKMVQVFWQTNANTVSYGWKISYTSYTTDKCVAPMVATLSGNVSNTIFAWKGDTVSIISSSGNVLAYRRTGVNGPDDSVGVSMSFTADMEGQTYLVDPWVKSRVVTLVVLPGSSTTWEMSVSFPAGGGYMLSGSISGTNSPIYVTIGDILIFNAQSPVTGNELELLNSLKAPLSLPAAILGGQQSFRITFDTSSMSEGLYYFGKSLTKYGVNVPLGEIHLAGRPNGMSCIACGPTDGVCYLGSSFTCPAYSYARPGTINQNGCICVAGYYTEQTDLKKYARSQAMDTGGKHTCAILGEMRQLYCWGLSVSGQTGYTGIDVDVIGVRAVPGLTNISMVSTGADFTCVVLMSNSHVKCFGDNQFGQLGQNSVKTNSKSEEASSQPEIIFSADGYYAVKNISCNQQSCCVVITTKNFQGNLVTGIRCWGRNNNGQLGVAAGNAIGLGGVTTMVSILDLSFSGQFVAWVSHGGTHACALTSVGDVFCWGSNTYGELGAGINDVMRHTPGIVDVNGKSQIVRCNNRVCCVVTALLSVKCWGQGLKEDGVTETGRLGSDVAYHIGLSPAYMGINLPTVQLGTGRLAVDIGVGDSQTCVLMDNNNVKCWGAVDGTILGDQPNEMFDFLPSILLDRSQTALQISAKGMVQCVVLNSYGMSCWGNNDYWQLGVPTVQSLAWKATDSVNGYLNVSNMTLVPFPDGVSVVRSSGIAFSKSCSICPANYYCDGLNDGVNVVACRANSASVFGSGSSSACVCLDGYYDFGGACVLCPIGKYCVSGNIFNCPAFSGGSPGLSKISMCNCFAGYTPGTNGVCNPCPVGMYKDSVGNGNCVACPMGTSGKNIGSNSSAACVPCVGGTYALAGSSQCVPCQVGSSAGVGSSTCLPCNKGTYAEMGYSVCFACPKGTYQGEAIGDRLTCLNCVGGMYSDVMGADSSNVCKLCPAGTFSLSGSSNCTACPPNFYSVSGGMCTRCPGNSTSVGGMDIDGCICNAGFMRDMTGIPFSCSPCVPGTYGTDGRNCLSCPAGKYQGKSMMTSISACLDCPKGSFSEEKSSSCTVCSVGKFTNIVGASVCASCLNGYYAPANSTGCTMCPLGTYSDKAIGLRSECMICPAGYICTDPSQKVMCPLGTFSDVTGKFLSSCSDCADNYYCPLPYLRNACPSGTISKPRTTSMLGCTCAAGVSCSYKKVVEVVVSLNISAVYFGVKQVQELFVNAVAKSAQVSPSNVYLSKIVNKDTGAVVDVQLYSGTGGNRRRVLEEPNGQGIHVLLSVLNAEKIEDLDQHLVQHGFEKSMDYAWYAPHHVVVTKEG